MWALEERHAGVRLGHVGWPLATGTLNTTHIDWTH